MVCSIAANYLFALQPTKAMRINNSGRGGVRGILIEPCGIPVEGVEVALHDNRGKLLIDITDKHGEFRIGNLLPGKYHFSTKKPKYWNLGADIEIRPDSWLTYGQQVNEIDSSGGAIRFKNYFSFYTQNANAFSISVEDISKIPIL